MHLVPIVVNRQVLVDGALAHGLDPVHSRVALIAGLEAKRHVGRQQKLKPPRQVHPARRLPAQSPFPIMEGAFLVNGFANGPP